MSIRAVWVLPLPGNGPEGLVFIKKYPTVEKRALVFTGTKDHVPVPPENLLYDATLEELGLKHPSTKYVEARDTCEKQFQKPVFEAKVPGGKLWPVVIIEKFGLLFCCLPLVEQGCEPRPPLINILGISLGFSLLGAMADFMGPLPRDFTTSHPKLLELLSYMCQASPFGTLNDINPVTIREVLQNKHSTQLVSTQLVSTHTKQAAWRPILTKGKAVLQFSINEQVRAVLYNSNNMEDVCSVYGTISCKADLEGVNPEVALTLTVPNDSPPLDNLMVHPCVQGGDTQLLQSGLPGTTPPKMAKRSLRFMPPRESFTLGYYTSSASFNTPPITASYQMKGNEREVNLLVKVKLNAKVRNAMEYCEVQLPFFNRGIILDINVTPSSGNVVLPTDRRRLGWNLGQKFPSKTLEATLQAKVQFEEYNGKKQATGMYEDPFCVGLNTYASIYFKVPDYTYTGCQIDPRSVQIQPSAKPKVTLAREFVTAEYKVWNSHGDAQAVFPVPKNLRQ